MSIMYVEKRNGNVVTFDLNYIKNAIFAAARSVGGSNDDISEELAGAVYKLIEEMNRETVNVEQIQDVVERVLIESGHASTAKAYILYRKEREDARREEQEMILKKVERGEITVHSRDGAAHTFDMSEIEKFVDNCAKGLENVEAKKVIEGAKQNFYDGITTQDINKALLMAARSFIERDQDYSRLAARILINDLYEQILGVKQFDEGFTEKYREGFKVAIDRGIEIGRLDARLKDINLDELLPMMDPMRDENFQYLGIQTLYDRYFLRDYDQNILELPQYFLMRVAMGLCLEEKEPIFHAKRFYEVMSSLRYLPSTPTLFHSGTTHPQMSSCYLTTVKDDLSQIFKAIGDNAQLAKWSGGIGNDWSNIRGTGSMIKSTNVGSQGVIPFLKIVDSTTAAINRSGKRRGATCVYLETWHYDIEAFLDLRKNTGDDRRRTHDINTANWVPDLFMKRVMAGGMWTLFSPNETPELHGLYGKAFEEKYMDYEKRAEAGDPEVQTFRKIEAAKLWRKMITVIFETGHPWITFKDPCNIRSPQDHDGVVNSSNLCTEITLNTSETETAVCNLGSINLSKHVNENGFDKDVLATTIEVAMRMLDNVIDLNFYPTQEAKNSNFRHRPVGLGVMGLQDAFFIMKTNFDSAEAVKLSDNLMEYVSYHAILNSSKLAKERGAYETFKGSKWDRNIFPVDTVAMLESERGMETGVDCSESLDWSEVRAHVQAHGMRNSNTMAIAPTATISNIAGCLPTIEPIYNNLYVKSNVSGEFTIINEFLIDDLKAEGIWNDEMLSKIKYHNGNISAISEIPQKYRELYKEAFQIDPIWYVRHAAYRGKWIDQSQSVNLFIASQSGKLISDAYMEAWKHGLKTTYYLRSLAASSIEKSSLDINKNYESAGVDDSDKGVAAVAPVAPAACGLSPEECEACQ
ncbi:ribonucleoside-diphosphate reductase subunit alpha [Candidatus Peregrinibacteria bacterium HGW-Peregrinibacteria-1]|jgi:ribonucleoside-diphosphate reductase alpha chain|nr:MAG: ribonucleoside-diphosphate reductase subunit alpha [Candidatus Peregrinibacteria bacterium HGW-Peregrinibacteria-1]